MKLESRALIGINKRLGRLARGLWRSTDAPKGVVMESIEITPDDLLVLDLVRVLNKNELPGEPPVVLGALEVINAVTDVGLNEALLEPEGVDLACQRLESVGFILDGRGQRQLQGQVRQGDFEAEHSTRSARRGSASVAREVRTAYARSCSSC